MSAVGDGYNDGSGEADGGLMFPVSLRQVPGEGTPQVARLGTPQVVKDSKYRTVRRREHVFSRGLLTSGSRSCPLRPTSARCLPQNSWVQATSMVRCRLSPTLASLMSRSPRLVLP